MLASGFQPTSVVMPSELTQNARQDAKNQLANEMKAFLQSQSQQNPRLRRLRVNQADVQTSITHPPMQSSIDSRSGPMSQFSDSAPQHGRRAAPGNGGRKPQPPPLPIGDSEALNDSQKKHFPHPPDHSSNQQPMSYQPQPPGNGYPGYPPRPNQRYDNYGYGGPMMQGPPQWGPNPYTRAPVYDDFYTGFDDFNRGPAPGGYGSGGFPPMQSQIPPLPPISSSSRPQYQPAYQGQEGPRIQHNMESNNFDQDYRSQKAKDYGAELQQQIADKKAAQERENAQRRGITNQSRQDYSYGENQVHTGRAGVRQAAQQNFQGQMNTVQDPAVVKQNKNEYMIELNEQIRLKKERQELEKMRNQIDDAKKEQEIAGYSPWGKQGAGAPYGSGENAGVRGRKMAELQGSNLFGGARQPPPQAQQFQQQQQQQSLPPPPSGGQNFSQSDGGYQTEDIFGGQRNSFLETLRTLALNPAQLNTLFQQGNVGGPSNTVPQSSFPPAGVTSNSSKPSNGNESQGPQSFLRGVKDINALPQWEREEILKKQKNQNDVQSVLQQQIAYKEAEKAAKLAKKKEEDDREQLRIQHEQEMLRSRYAKEMEEQRMKDEEARLENEQKAAEKAAKTKTDQQAEVKRLASPQQMGMPEPARWTSPTQHYQDHRPRIPSPPVPAVQKRIQSSGNLAPGFPVQGLHSSSQPMSHFKQSENLSETRAVLDQLAAIQRELADEDRKIVQDMTAPMSFNMFSDIPGHDMSERKRTPSVPHKNSEPFLPQLLASNTHQKPSDYILFDSNVSGNNLNLNSVNRMLDTKSSMNFMLKRQEGVLHRQEKELTELRASLKKPAKTPLWLSEDRLDSDSVTDYERKRQEESEDDEDVQRRHHHSHHHKSRMRHTSLRRHHRDRDFERQEESDSEDGRRVQEHRHRHLSVDRRSRQRLEEEPVERYRESHHLSPASHANERKHDNHQRRSSSMNSRARSRRRQERESRQERDMGDDSSPLSLERLELERTRGGPLPPVTRSASSINMDWIESLNERRLARLGELQRTSHDQKALGETDIIDAFLKRSSNGRTDRTTRLIPSSESVLKPLLSGRV